MATVSALLFLVHEIKAETYASQKQKKPAAKSFELMHGGRFGTM